MQSYFPSIKPYATHTISVEAPHQLYVEECGNPEGIPVLFLHGGPGSGCNEDSRRFFDPNQYRIILFDQRGCGRSTPYGELENNNTQALVQDIETIRNKLNIDRWVVFGGSWGATLALVYAQAFPERVISMILCGAFLGRKEDKDWFLGSNGVSRIFPDYWSEFKSVVPPDQTHNILYEYYDLLTGSDEVSQMRAAESWAKWETSIFKLNLDTEAIAKKTEPHNCLAYAKISCHYILNNCFLEPDQILRNMDRIKSIPAILIHGRYDMVCVLENSWLLHQSWPASKLYIIPASGHSSSEPEILNALILATQEI